jgi:hypothetical protein
MANVLKSISVSNINGLQMHLAVIPVQKPIFYIQTSSVLKTVTRNFKNSGGKEDYSVNISFAT